MRCTATLLVLIATLAVSACAPWPHDVTNVPEVTGHLTAAGAPVAGAGVAAVPGSSLAACEAMPSAQTTDDRGVFQLPPAKALRLVYRPLVDPLAVNHWVLCIRRGDATVLGFLGINIQSSSHTVALSCDFDEQHPQSEPGVRGICRFVPEAQPGA